MDTDHIAGVEILSDAWLDNHERANEAPQHADYRQLIASYRAVVAALRVRQVQFGMTQDTPRHGEITYEDNPEFYEFKIQLGQHVLGMATATPTWRADVLAEVKRLQREAVKFRRLREAVAAAVDYNRLEVRITKGASDG